MAARWASVMRKKDDDDDIVRWRDEVQERYLCQVRDGAKRSSEGISRVTRGKKFGCQGTDLLNLALPLKVGSAALLIYTSCYFCELSELYVNYIASLLQVFKLSSSTVVIGFISTVKQRAVVSSWSR